MSGYEVKATTSSKLRARLGHPVIDGDAHIIECAFVLPDFLKMVGGSDIGHWDVVDFGEILSET